MKYVPAVEIVVVNDEESLSEPLLSEAVLPLVAVHVEDWRLAVTARQNSLAHSFFFENDFFQNCDFSACLIHS